MNNFSKIIPFFSLLMASNSFHAAKLSNQAYPKVNKVDYTIDLPTPKRILLVSGYCKTYHTPTDIHFFIKSLLYGNPFQYRNQPLPQDLSGRDLRGYDFTGCKFEYTNLTDTNLTNTTLTNTTCDYQKTFQNNIKDKSLNDDSYQKNLLKSIKSIAEVYPKLKIDAHKASLLPIAYGIASLPFYKKLAFHIKMAYWSCVLLQLKQKLGKPYGKRLICSLESDLYDDVQDYCWQTKYPQDKIAIDTKLPHTNFTLYLQEFHKGLTQYKCKSYYDYGFNYYRVQIQGSIKGLQKTYPKIKCKELQQEAYNIAHALSKSYQIGGSALLFHYLSCQNRLINLKNSPGVPIKNDIHGSLIGMQTHTVTLEP